VSYENEVLVLVLTHQRSVKWCNGHIVPICTLHHNDTSLMLLWQLLSLNGSTSLARCAMMLIQSVNSSCRAARSRAPLGSAFSTHQGEPACAPGIQGFGPCRAQPL